MPGLSRTQATRQIALAIVEVAVAVALASLAVAALQPVSPVTGSEVLYLLAVLFVAIRRGQAAALGCAVASVLALNFFFIAPRHRLTIADSHDVAALAVLLIAAVVVGRLASAARQRAAEADRRAAEATVRQRESALLASTASALMSGEGAPGLAERLAGALDRALGEGRARIELTGAPTPLASEWTVALPLRDRPGWLHGARDSGWDRADAERLAEPLARMIDVALERKRVAEREADAEATRRADVAKTAVLHAISHDLRSPLTAITTAAAALRSETIAGADRRALVEAIDGESARLARLVDDLVDLSRIQADAVHPRADWCDLHDVLARAADHVRATRGEHPVALELPTDLPLVRADPVQLERVFTNLIENAVKFSPAGAPVRVRGGTGAGRVTVRVIDRGRGVPSSQRAQVFEPFFRGRGQTGAGSGLGLAICRGFVQANGGRITLQSGAGEETAFAVSLPLAAQPVGSP